MLRRLWEECHFLLIGHETHTGTASLLPAPEAYIDDVADAAELGRLAMMF
jgi:hypothetical protein